MKRLSNAEKQEFKRIMDEVQDSSLFKVLNALRQGQVKKQTAKPEAALDETRK